MSQTRKYGIVCSRCGTRLEVGQVDLEDDAGPDELQRVLSESNWKSRIVECPKCSSGKQYTQDEMILLD